MGKIADGDPECQTWTKRAEIEDFMTTPIPVIWTEASFIHSGSSLFPDLVGKFLLPFGKSTGNKLRGVRDFPMRRRSQGVSHLFSHIHVTWTWYVF